MKYIILLVSIFCCFGFSMGQTWMREIETKLDAEKLEQANADISQIEIEFCDKPEEKTIEYVLLKPWIQDICYKATNYSDKDIVVNIWFVDGTFTNDQRKNKACMQQGEDQKFGKYVTGYRETFIVQANNISYQHASIQLPYTSKWTVNWCLVYYTKGVEMGGQMNFTVLMRKAKFIDITIKPKAESLKLKAIGIFLGIIVLLLFFRNFQKKHLPPK